jgi:hypothetical protein
MLGGADGQSLFIAASIWRGMDHVMDEEHNGQVLIADVTTPRVGWPWFPQRTRTRSLAGLNICRPARIGPAHTYQAIGNTADSVGSTPPPTGRMAMTERIGGPQCQLTQNKWNRSLSRLRLHSMGRT